jgi:hypothetical protein
MVSTELTRGAIDSLRHVLLKAREPAPGSERDYERAYAFWLSMWRDTFANVNPNLTLHSDVFLRHREVSVVLSDDQAVGLMMYDFRDLRVRAHRDLSAFAHYPEEVIAALRADGHERVMLMGQLTVHPNWRKQRVGPFMSDALVGLSIKRFLESDSTVMIAFTRNDRGTQKLGYRFGAVPLRENHAAHGIPSDVIAFRRDRVKECPLPGMQEIIERLWLRTCVTPHFSNLPKALKVPAANEALAIFPPLELKHG